MFGRRPDRGPSGGQAGSAILFMLMIYRQLRELGVLDGRPGKKIPFATLGLAGLCVAVYFFSDVVDEVTYSLDIPEITSVQNNAVQPIAIW